MNKEMMVTIHCGHCDKDVLISSSIDDNQYCLNCGSEFDSDELEKAIAKNKKNPVEAGVTLVSGGNGLLYSGDEVVITEDGRLAIATNNTAVVLSGSKIAKVTPMKNGLIGTLSVLLSNLKQGDVIRDNHSGAVVFLVSSDGSQIKIKDPRANKVEERDILEPDATGALTVTKYVSVTEWFKKDAKLVQLTGRYGASLVAEAAIRQFLGSGAVDATAVEMDLNPVMVNFALAKQIGDLISTLKK